MIDDTMRKWRRPINALMNASTGRDFFNKPGPHRSDRVKHTSHNMETTQREDSARIARAPDMCQPGFILLVRSRKQFHHDPSRFYSLHLISNPRDATCVAVLAGATMTSVPIVNRLMMTERTARVLQPRRTALSRQVTRSREGKRRQ